MNYILCRYSCTEQQHKNLTPLLFSSCTILMTAGNGYSPVGYSSVLIARLSETINVQASRLSGARASIRARSTSVRGGFGGDFLRRKILRRRDGELWDAHSKAKFLCRRMVRQPASQHTSQQGLSLTRIRHRQLVSRPVFIEQPSNAQLFSLRRANSAWHRTAY